MSSRRVPARVVVDGCSIDPLVDYEDALPVLVSAVNAGSVEVLYEHIARDEIADTDDPERRQRLLDALDAVARPVPSGAFVLDYSKLDHARLSDDEAGFEALQIKNRKYTKDALIAITAKVEGAALVTEERRRIRHRARAEGVDVWYMLELITAIDPASRDGWPRVSA